MVLNNVAAGPLCWLVVVGAFLYFGLPWLYSRWKRSRLKQHAAKRNCIILTLDDGPSRQLTPMILDILAERNVKAMFFLLGRNIRGNEDVVRRIHAEGHEIGSHTWGHLHAWKVAPWRSVLDIRRGMKAIDEALGVRGGRYPFRPPHGKLNLATWLYLLAKRIPIVYWTCDSCDARDMKLGSVDEMTRNIDRMGGGVVLAHDYDRGSEDARQYVLEVLGATLNMAQKQGFHLSTLSRLRGIGP